MRHLIVGLSLLITTSAWAASLSSVPALMRDDYTDRKQGNYVTLRTEGDKVILSERRFDGRTGQEIAPQETVIDARVVQRVQQERAETAAHLAQLDAFLADVEAHK